MSTPQNPLADFKSYSYYHVLAICDTTTTAEALADASDGVVDMWQHPTPGYFAGDKADQYVKDLGRYSPKTINNGKYCVLINGATDAAYVISKVVLNTITSAGAVDNDRFNSIAIEGSMEISEPRGISFLDQITRCCLALGKDAAHVTFILKTFFVGYDHKNEIQTIPNVAPVMFIVTEATGSFTESGGQYSLGFAAMTHGISRFPQYSKMVSSPPLLGNTLSKVVSNLNTEMQLTYNKMYDCVYKQVAASVGNYPDKDGIIASLKRVGYEIRLAPLYTTSEYVMEKPPQATSTTGQCAKSSPDPTTEADTPIAIGANMSVESALQVMMQHCTQVKADSTTGITRPFTLPDGTVLPVGTKMNFRIHSKLVTRKDVGLGGYTVVYTVEPFPVPTMLMSTVGMDVDLLKRNTLEFDYIYTGKNVDILEFDMKVNMGLAYLQIATLTNTFKTQGDVTPTQVTTPNFKQVAIMANRGKPTDENEVHVDIPVFFSTNLELPMNRTSTSPPKDSSYMYDLTKQASLESIDVSMKITGNVNLLHAINAATVSRDDTSTSQAPYNATPTSSMPGDRAITNTQEIGMANSFSTTGKSSLPDWGRIPGYAKVNISMPRHNDDLLLFEGEGTQNFTKPFWFTGHYYVYSIEHVFDDGEFTQNLQMIGMPDPEIFKALESRTTGNAAFSTEVEGCYTNATKCPPTAQEGGSTAPLEKAAASPTVKQSKSVSYAQLPPTEIDLLLTGNFPPSRIIGYDQASDDVKAALLQASNGSVINHPTLVMMASLEALKFHAESAAKNSSAKGLFQFLDATWNGMSLVKNDKSKQVPPPRGEPDPRFNPLLSAQAGAEYAASSKQTAPTLIYMHHLFGSGAFRGIMRGEPTSKPMVDVYKEGNWWVGSKESGTRRQLLWPEVAAGNRFQVTDTADQIRPQIAARMWKNIKDGAGESVQPSTIPTPTSPTPSSVSIPSGNVAGSTAGAPLSVNKGACDPKSTNPTPSPCGDGDQPASNTTGSMLVSTI